MYLYLLQYLIKIIQVIGRKGGNIWTFWYFSDVDAFVQLLGCCANSSESDGFQQSAVNSDCVDVDVCRQEANVDGFCLHTSTSAACCSPDIMDSRRQVSQLLLTIELKYLGLWLLLPPRNQTMIPLHQTMTGIEF